MTEAVERAMVITAHPDDPEFGAGGTIAKLAKEGREVTYVIVTNGNKGSSDRAITPERLARIREDEQRNAARTLGVGRVEFLGYEDGEVEDTRQLRLDITREIRRWRPGLIIAQSPNRTYTNFHAWHRDHRITGGVVLDCVYPLARNHLSFPEQHAPWPAPTRLRIARGSNSRRRSLGCRRCSEVPQRPRTSVKHQPTDSGTWNAPLGAER